MVLNLFDPYAQFTIHWNQCWTNFFSWEIKKNLKKVRLKETVLLRNKFERPYCLRLINWEKNSLMICTGRDTTKSDRVVFGITVENKSYNEIYRRFSRLRRRELNYASKNYKSYLFHNKIEALEVLESKEYQSMHYKFYKSFPSPQLPIGLLKCLVSSDLLNVTKFENKLNEELVGITFTCTVHREYCIPFFIYKRSEKALKGLSTFMWNQNIERACRSGVSIINLGTSQPYSNVAKFKISLGSDLYSTQKNQNTWTSTKLLSLISSKLMLWFIGLTPKAITGIFGYVAYKFFAKFI